MSQVQGPRWVPGPWRTGRGVEDDPSQVQWGAGFRGWEAAKFIVWREDGQSSFSEGRSVT